ncbi:histone-lysine N-methyltransferase SETMAR [Elysia marginata]|uniref:Histone-lysine N-methyltransferase SETMAR n=1 Tax=Elysia marginata TaxID=1093978 RepID=A0AAV4I2V6_9GAST|nr:histone-lysine N-methyltransferase SETMAR [Elysia marginata]
MTLTSQKDLALIRHIAENRDEWTTSIAEIRTEAVPSDDPTSERLLVKWLPPSKTGQNWRSELLCVFLFSKGIRLSEIHKQIAEAYGEGAMSRSRVYQWCTWFGEGRTSLNDELKFGRPKTSANEENTTRVDELIK